MKKKAFTLVELLLVVMVVAILLPIVFSIFSRIKKIKAGVDARQSLVEQTYDMFERINILMQDYTIDYEEYFNRRVTGCSSNLTLGSFVWDVNSSGYCSNFTTYGNASFASPTNHVFQYCSSSPSDSSKPTDPHTIVRSFSTCDAQGFPNGKKSSFGQYRWLFWDMKGDVDYISGAVGDSDDVDMGSGPQSIGDSDHVKELYLISQDGINRLFLRRTLIMQADADGDGVITGNEKLYSLQMLRLRGFDAGSSHNFSNTSSSTNPGLYDGQIDTWACDYSEGFYCNGSSIDLSGPYSGYKLPTNVNDGWINLFNSTITLDDWNLMIYPTVSPEYGWLDNSAQINPYFRVSLLNKLYADLWKNKVGNVTSEFQLAAQTLFNTKNFYAK